jgi:hypothetical protein
VEKYRSCDNGAIPVITVGIFPRSPYPNDPKRLLANPKALKGRVGVSDSVADRRTLRALHEDNPYPRTPCTLHKLA